MPSSQGLSSAVVWMLVPLWLAATGWLFWVFQVRDLRPFSSFEFVEALLAE